MHAFCRFYDHHSRRLPPNSPLSVKCSARYKSIKASPQPPIRAQVKKESKPFAFYNIPVSLYKPSSVSDRPLVHSRMAVIVSLARGHRRSGDLLPWRLPLNRDWRSTSQIAAVGFSISLVSAHTQQCGLTNNHHIGRFIALKIICCQHLSTRHSGKNLACPCFRKTEGLVSFPF